MKVSLFATEIVQITGERTGDPHRSAERSLV